MLWEATGFLKKIVGSNLIRGLRCTCDAYVTGGKNE